MDRHGGEGLEDVLSAAFTSYAELVRATLGSPQQILALFPWHRHMWPGEKEWGRFAWLRDFLPYGIETQYDVLSGPQPNFRQRVGSGLQEFDVGQTISHEEVMRNLAKWLHSTRQ